MNKKEDVCEFEYIMGLIEENQTLKMNLYNKEHYITRLKTAKNKLGKKNGNMMNQQKEFTKYLKGRINLHTINGDGYVRDLIIEILQKYDEIMRVSNENKDE